MRYLPKLFARTVPILLLAIGLPALAKDGSVPGGELHALGPDNEALGTCPLEHTEVRVDISGFIARVTLTQRFSNPFEAPIEAVYTFPMSDRGAVDAMTMRIGDRTISGVIKERDEANRIYQEAKQAGQAAAKLDQERPNIFTQSVANILPGEAIEITISYVEYLKYEAGEYEFSFPMVVGPRYVPASGGPPEEIVRQPVLPLPKGDPNRNVPDADRITPPVTPEGTRAGHDINLAVNLNAGVPIQGIESALHDVAIKQNGEHIAEVQLKNNKTIPNRDFILKYKVAGAKIGDAVLTHADADGGYFTLILQPPDRVAPESITSKEMIFVIDSSGSMRGFPIEKAKEAMAMAIKNMNPRDTFNLVSFAGGLGYCFDKTVPNSEENRIFALKYLENLTGSGGTEMMPAIRAALGNQNDPERLRVVCFMTDGYIGNDMAIIKAIQRNAGTARVFSFGIGNSVNRFLIEGMAREGRGDAEIVTLESDGAAAAKRFHERIHSPLLTDITLEFDGLDVEDIYPDPKALPDLFAARPLILKGRYTNAGQGSVTIRGNTANGKFERTIDVTLPETHEEDDVLAPLWARAKVAHIMNSNWLGVQQNRPRHDVKAAITKIGLQYNLVTQYTSFVAVEERVINEGGETKTVQVPVEMADGVSYEGVFGDGQSQTMAGMALNKVSAGAQVSTLGRRFSTSPEPQLESLGYLEGVPARPAPAEEPPSVGRAEDEVAPERKDEGSALTKEQQAKLNPALVGLAKKVNNGRYADGKVTVVNGMVAVEITLNDDSADNLRELRQNGVQIVSHTRASKRLMARVGVEKLDALAKLGFVTRITPAKI